MSVCDVVPALLRGNHSSMLLHVDDCLMAADRKWMTEVFLPELRKKYKLTVKILDGVGSSIELLKKTYISLENGIEIVPAGRHVQILAKKFEEANGKPARVAKTPVLQQLFTTDDTPLLSAKYHEHFRSLVGLLMYISQDRWDIMFAVKSLACYLSSPTELAWRALARVVGYMVWTTSFSMQMHVSSKGHSVFSHMADGEPCKDKNLLECFSDSDWQGSWGKTWLVRLSNLPAVGRPQTILPCLATLPTRAHASRPRHTLCAGPQPDQAGAQSCTP